MDHSKFALRQSASMMSQFLSAKLRDVLSALRSNLIASSVGGSGIASKWAIFNVRQQVDRHVLITGYLWHFDRFTIVLLRRHF
jgi:hypothetical protein